jgi:glycosyltransferase involved in cell wall biosynthesis
MLIFQLAREVWWYELPLPISALGFVLEPTYLMVYRHTDVFTISRSTEQDLRRLGFVGNITQVPIGINTVESVRYPKADSPTFLFVGRMSPSKRIEHIIQALAQFRRVTGNGTLWLAGSGPASYQSSLLRLASRLAVEENVVFWGHVTEIDKQRLLTMAHALVMASVREGWGLVVTEANACGTPAIVYDVPGLRDSVHHESNGLVVHTQPSCLSDAMVRLTTDPALYTRLQEEGRRWSRTFSLDDAAEVVRQALVATDASASPGVVGR